MRRILTLIFIFMWFVHSFSQNTGKEDLISKSSVQINDIVINEAKRIEYVCTDSIEFYQNEYSAEKYKVVCKKKIPTVFTRDKQKRYRKATLKYDVYVIEDSSCIIRDSIIKDISLYLNKKEGLRIKNVYVKSDSYLLLIGSESNLIEDYIIYWYRNRVYKVVFAKNKFSLKKGAGGFNSISVLFKKSELEYIDFYHSDKQGKEAYEIVKTKYLKQQ